MIKIEKLNPFGRMCISLGMLPSSYKESLTYEEQLLWFMNYLQEEVIPAVNNNADAVIELQTLYTQIKSYVDNYFENLDVQEEINNKLDEMATDGSLTNLIKNYIDPLFESYGETINERLENQDSEILNFKNDVNERLNQQDSEIEAVSSGSPLVASSTSEMTDTSRIYVNTTDGKWYYYDGDSWEIGGTYQATGISSSDPIITTIKRNIAQISEEKPNLYNVDNVQIGKNWTGSSASNRAVEYIAVEPNTKYTVNLLDTATFSQVDILEKETNQGSSPILVNQYVNNSNPSLIITTSADTHYFCVQFQKLTDVEASDFSSNTMLIYIGESPLYGAVDRTARQLLANAVTPYDTFKELAASRLSGEHRFSGYNMRTCVSYSPYVYTHTEEAHVDPYYDVTQTLKQYYPTTELKATKNICNNLKTENIDFTPSDNGFTRIIVGKNNDDLFFVSYVASNRVGQFGNPKYDKLEVTTDFVNFTTLIRGSQDDIETDGIVLTNMTNIKVDSIKQFSDGTYILAIRCLDTTNNTNYTHFYRMNSEMTQLTHCRYTNFNNEVVDMIDEYNNQVYDWHIFISNNKALVTTYGSRNPASDLGRVWYTENSGYGWKQVFQTSLHLPENVNAHTHGVLIDTYTNRLYVIVGENYSSIYYSDDGYNSDNNSWTRIDLTSMPCYNFQEGTQVVNGYPFKNCILFGSDNAGVGALYRFNKLDDGDLSYIESAHEFLPNKYNGTFYCAAELSRRDTNSPLFMCETHENAMLTEEDNENLNEYNKARVVATLDGVHIVEIWTDDTFGTRTVYINNEETTRKYSMCTRGMNFWLLKNGNGVLKFTGRDYQYFGGNPMFSVTGNTGDSCKVRIFKDLEKYL